MEKRTILFSIIILLVLSVGSVVFFVSNPGVHDTIITFANEGNNKEVSVLNLIRPNLKRIGKEEKSHDLSFEFPKNVDLDEIRYSSDYLEKTYELSVSGIDEYFFTNFPVESGSDWIDDIIFSSAQAKGEIKIKFNRYACVKTETSGRFLYLDFFRPSEYYEKIVIIDPGSNENEKDINLEIANKVADEFENEKIGIFCTRLSDSNPHAEERIKFSDDLEADLYINISQNSTASGRESDINGTQTQYYSADKSGASKSLAQSLQENVIIELNSNDLGITAGDNNLILQEMKCPAVILNVGYITNSTEFENLKNSEYQKKCADGIKKTVMEYFNENGNSNK